MRGNGDGAERNPKEVHHDFIASMKSRIETENAAEFSGQLNRLLGGVIGFLFAAFFVPFLIVYAYNGLQPAVWPDISYLPAVAGLFVFRTLAHMLRSE